MTGKLAGKAAVASLASVEPVAEAPRIKAAISRRAIGLGGSLILFIGVYFYLATHLIQQVNLDFRTGGQERGIDLAETAAGRVVGPSGGVTVTEVLWKYLPHYTDGVTGPLWPWTAGKFGAESREALFLRGKWFHVIFSGAFCCVLSLCASRTFTLAATLNLLGLAGFGVFLKRSVYFEPELLYYVFFFLSWVCSILVLRKNSIWIYALLGVLLGLAYLAKASALPLLVFFVLLSSGHWLEALIFHRKRARVGEFEGKWMPQNHFIGLAFLAAGFLAVSGARLHYAEGAFGSPWHSYPAWFMWLDSREEAAEFMRNYPGKEALEALEELEESHPSLPNYVKFHDVDEMADRLREGSVSVVGEFLRPARLRQEGKEIEPWEEILPLRGYYLAALFVILCVVGCAAQIARQHHEEAEPAKADSRGARRVVVFLLGAVTLYAAGYGWYARIETGDRFLMMLFLPLVFSFIWGAESLMRRIPSGEGGTALRRGYAFAHLILLGSICYRVAELVWHPFFEW